MNHPIRKRQNSIMNRKEEEEKEEEIHRTMQLMSRKIHTQFLWNSSVFIKIKHGISIIS